MSARTLLLSACVLAASCTIPPEETARPRLGRTAQAVDWGSTSLVPIRIRTGHTATLLGTGEVLVAGGKEAPQTTEIVDIYGGKVAAGPALVLPRASHTATMLFSGKVLLAGGETAAAELYDPIARSTTATGSMSAARSGHAAIRLRSGKVLVAGGTTDGRSEIYDPASGTWSEGPTRSGTSKLFALATLADGRIVATAKQETEILDAAASAWTSLAPGISTGHDEYTLTRFGDDRLVSGFTDHACSDISFSMFCAVHTSVVAADASSVADASASDDTNRSGFTAARTVEGDVVVIGGTYVGSAPTVLATERFFADTAIKSPVSDGTPIAVHTGPTATVLPGGDILVVGGPQAKLDRRPSPGAWSLSGSLIHPRTGHASTRLHDGTVLVAGGQGGPAGETVDESEVIDPITKTSKAVPGRITFGANITLTTLRDGSALLVAGKTSALFTAEQGFVAGPAPSYERRGHTATLLASGRVLVVGGAGAGIVESEIFDPTTTTWSLGPKPAHAFEDHGAVLLPNGLVLVIGGADVELFDERTMSFRATAAPGASREGATVRLLPSGQALVSGGDTAEADLFDPVSETWHFAGAIPGRRTFAQRWDTVPSGRLVGSGGYQDNEGAVPSRRITFDPLAHPTGDYVAIDTGAHPAFAHAVTLAGTGDVVQTGGSNCHGPCPPTASASISVYHDGAAESLRPKIDSAPAVVTAGTKVPIAGAGFANGAEASDGTRASSAVNHPTAIWLSDAGDAVVPSTILDFTDTTATWRVPTTALYGHGFLFVNVAGVFSHGASVTILPALAATGCANDAQCKGGFCADGVCCDRRCDGACEACTAALKSSGEDGVCGVVPPGTGRCILKLGDACNGGNECGTGFCAQGVCCDSTCDGQCLSCNLQGKAGRCSAINEGSCGAACDGDHTLKQVGVPDVDCSPYKCGGPQCSQTCGSALDCVAPAVCSYDGHCVPPAVPEPASDSVCGCRIVGAPGPSSVPVLAALLPLAAALRRRRRRAE